MTADQPLSENSIARGRVGGGLIVIRYSNTCLKSFRTLSLKSEGMHAVRAQLLFYSHNFLTAWDTQR